MNMNNFRLALLPLALALAGCTLAPHYQRPALPVDAKYDQATPVATSPIYRGRTSSPMPRCAT